MPKASHAHRHTPTVSPFEFAHVCVHVANIRPVSARKFEDGIQHWTVCCRGIIPRLPRRLARDGEISITALLNARADVLASKLDAAETFDEFQASERGAAAIAALQAQHAAAMCASEPPQASP